MQVLWCYLRALADLTFFLEFLPNDKDGLGYSCALADLAKVHVVEIFFGVNFKVLFSDFCYWGRFQKESKEGKGY